MWFDGKNITESELQGKVQTLHLYNGSIVSESQWDNERVGVITTADPESSTIAVEIASTHLRNGTLGVFLDYPYMTDKHIELVT